MDKLKELSDFSMFDGSIPCVLCKKESSKTLLGDHWKCSECDHLFNQDGSPTGVDCYCKTCHKEQAKEAEGKQKALEKFLKKLKKGMDKKKKKNKTLDE